LRFQIVGLILEDLAMIILRRMLDGGRLGESMQTNRTNRH